MVARRFKTATGTALGIPLAGIVFPRPPGHSSPNFGHKKTANTLRGAVLPACRSFEAPKRSLVKLVSNCQAMVEQKGPGSIDGSFFTAHSPNIRLQATQCRGPAPQQLSSSVPRGIGRLSPNVRRVTAMATLSQARKAGSRNFREILNEEIDVASTDTWTCICLWSLGSKSSLLFSVHGGALR